MSLKQPTPSSNHNKRNFLLLFVRMQEELCLCQNEVAFGSFHSAGLSQAYGLFFMLQFVEDLQQKLALRNKESW